MPLWEGGQDGKRVHVVEPSPSRSAVGVTERDGLASLVAALHSKPQGTALAPHSVGVRSQAVVDAQLPPLALSCRGVMGSSLSAAAAEAIKGHGAMGSHAVSPRSANCQPQSPQLREGPSPAKRDRAHALRLAYSRLAGQPVASMSGISTCATPSLVSFAGDTRPIQPHSPEQVVVELRCALTAAECNARIVAWSRDAEWPSALASSSALDDGKALKDSEAQIFPDAWHSHHSMTSVGKADNAHEGRDLESSSCWSLHDNFPGPSVGHPLSAASPSSNTSRSGHTRTLFSNALASPLIEDATEGRPLSSSRRLQGINEASPEKFTEQAVAELQAQLLSQAAAVAAAERRAELAERKQAESHSLMLSLQDALMQNAIPGSASVTPVTSPRRGTSSSAIHLHSRPASQGSQVSTPPRQPIGIRHPRGSGALARGVAAESAAIAREASRTAAARARDDANNIARLEAELQSARLERDLAHDAAREASLREVPKGLGQLWEQLLAAEAEAEYARRSNSVGSGHNTAAHPQGPGTAGAGSSQKKLIGEIWEQLRASYVDRDALKRSASHAQRQLQHYQRAASTSPSLSVKGDLSRAFSAAAEAATLNAQPPLEQVADYDAQQPHKSRSSSSSMFNGAHVQTSPFATENVYGGSSHPAAVSHSQRSQSPLGRQAGDANCQRAGQDVILQPSAKGGSQERQQSFPQWPSFPMSGSSSWKAQASRDSSEPSDNSSPGGKHCEASEDNIARPLGNSAAVSRSQTGLPTIAALAVGGRRKSPNRHGIRREPSHHHGIGFQAVLRMMVELPPLVALALARAAALPRLLSKAFQAEDLPLQLAPSDDVCDLARDGHDSSASTPTFLDRIDQCIVPVVHISSASSNSHSCNESETDRSPCSTADRGRDAKPGNDLDACCDQPARHAFGNSHRHSPVKAAAAKINAATAKSCSPPQLLSHAAHRPPGTHSAARHALSPAVKADVPQGQGAPVQVGSDTECAPSRERSASRQMPQPLGGVLRAEVPGSQAATVGILMAVGAAIVAMYNV